MRSARIAPVLIVPAVFALLITLVAAPAPATPVEPVTTASTSALTATRADYIERATRSVFRTPPPVAAKTAKPKPKPKPKPVVPKTVHKAVEKSVPGTKGDAQRYARSLVPADQWGCLKTLWTKESGWRTTATSPSGKHHGIPQLKSESLRGAGYKYQVDRGLAYIDHRYGTPCSAWAHFQSHNWY